MNRCLQFLLVAMSLAGCHAQTQKAERRSVSEESQALYKRAVAVSRDGHNEEALKLISEAIAKSPDYADGYSFRVALLLYNHSDPRPNEALQDAEKAVALDPDSAAKKKVLADCRAALAR